jgi:uncharacterized membrane protein
MGSQRDNDLMIFMGILCLLSGIALIIYSNIVINNAHHSDDNSNHTKKYVLTSFGIIAGVVMTIFGIILCLIPYEIFGN